MLRDPKLLTDTLNENEQAALQAWITFAKAEYKDGIKSITIFGSRARGDQNNDSDIDIAAIVANELATNARKVLRRKAAEINLHYDTALAILVLSESRWNELLYHERLIALDIEHEGIKL
ncbi:MAG: nucleotidyltransferase domain-containing protein [Deltaproteobacteria bacterium]|nr:nucleotidyltransferase domain-containing protein [Deltaproteobacteria bacterium]